MIETYYINPTIAEIPLSVRNGAFLSKYASQSRLFFKVNMKEQWKDIKGYKGYYQVSNLGRIKSLSRMICRPKNGKWLTKDKILKQYTRNGYKTIILLKNKIRKDFLVHRLVGLAFIPNIENKPEINHKDGIKHNNNIENLEWVTKSENHLHAFRFLNRKPTKYWLGKKGFRHHSSKPIVQSFNGTIVKIWDSMSDAHRNGYNAGHICDCCKNNRPHHRGYNWNYL